MGYPQIRNWCFLKRHLRGHAVEVLVTNLPPDVGALLTRQHQVIARRQLIAAHVDDATIYRKVRSGQWRLLIPGVILTTAGSPGTEQRRVAAAVYAGEQAQITGLGALHWYGFRHAPATEMVHVLVPHATRRRSAGFVVVQRALQLDPAARDSGPYRVVSAARAVVDACRLLTQLRDVRAIVAEAVQSRHTTPAAIDQEIRRAGRSRTGLARRALSEVVEGVRSAPEAELRDITQQSKILPTVLWNPTLRTLTGERLPTPDGWIDDAGIALEVDSAEHHAEGEGWTTTLDRHNALAEHDVQVLHITPAEIRTLPRKVLARIEQTYRSRLATGARARVVASVSKGTLLDARRQ
ncbi:MAG TPA: hypothetical protein VFY84_20805 [Jiangellales bacterium]|nr:hypothetical protein [Jiangellales bacterium]